MMIRVHCPAFFYYHIYVGHYSDSKIIKYKKFLKNNWRNHDVLTTLTHKDGDTLRVVGIIMRIKWTVKLHVFPVSKRKLPAFLRNMFLVQWRRADLVLDLV